MLNISSASCMKTFLFTALVSLNLMNAGGLEIAKSSFHAPHHLGNIKLSHDVDGFSVLKDGRKHAVAKYFVDKTVRNMPTEQVQKFLKHGYLSVNQMSDQGYSIQANGRINGGALGGAGAGMWIGRFVGQAIGYGAVAIVSLPALVGGPATYVVACTALGGTVMPLIETASHVTAIAGGIIGGVVSGPV